MLLNSSLPTIPQPNVSRSVQRNRQSKSQNDLDRKMDESNESLPDGHLGGTGGLQRHQSVSGTRHSGDGETLFAGTNQLGNQLGARFTKSINSSQSTPSLVQPTQISTEQDKTFPNDKDPSSKLNQVDQLSRANRQNEKDIVQDNKTTTITAATGANTTLNNTPEDRKPVTKAAKLVKRPSLSQAVQKTAPFTQQSESKHEQAACSTVTKEIADFKFPAKAKKNALSSVGRENTNELSENEENAEATDQPPNGQDAPVNTGSVNTLSSSPLRSADEDGDEADVEADEQLQQNSNNKSGTPDNKPDSLIADQHAKVGNWLGSTGIREFAEAAEPTKKTRPAGEKKNTNILHGHKFNNETEFPDSKVGKTGKETSPITGQLLTAPSAPPAVTSKADTINHPIRSQPDVLHPTDSSKLASVDSNRLSYQPEHTDSPEFIDSPDQSPPIDDNITYYNQLSYHPQNSSSMMSQQQQGQQQQTSLSGSKTDLYFPFARSVAKANVPYSSLANRPQEYRTLAAIPSRRSPARRGGEFKPINYPPTKNDTPQFISLSAENFTRAELEKPLSFSITSPRDSARVELIARARRSDIPPCRRSSHDLSPQPRDWYKGYSPTFYPTGSASVTSISDMMIPSDIAPVSLGERDQSGTTQAPLVRETFSTLAVSCCTSRDSSVPSSFLRGIYDNEQNTAGRHEPANDLLLDHGYAPHYPFSAASSMGMSTTEHNQPRGYRVYSTSLAAQSMAENARPHQTKLSLDVTAPSRSCAEIKLPLSPTTRSNLVQTEGDKQPERFLVASRSTSGLSTRNAQDQPSKRLDTRSTQIQTEYSPDESPQYKSVERSRNSIKHYSDKVDSTMRDGIEVGQRSVKELTRSVAVPPLANSSAPAPSSSTEAAASNLNGQQIEQRGLYPLAQQLFYYLLVGFIIYRLTGWLRIRPRFGNTTEEPSILYRIIMSILNWVFNID
ncbi:unnamed protein product [Calicophoron daubneyi]|uniref:Uncharacterized protein n=1 Tax=Calicophoron daubneyi TaxID=300641 RepID=A0AAV2TYM0_CALDB